MNERKERVDYQPSVAMRISNFVLWFRKMLLGLSKNEGLKTAESVAPPKRIFTKVAVEQTSFRTRDLFKISPKTGTGNSKVVLYLHGGAYIMGLLKVHWDFVAALSEELTCSVWLPDYPIAPKANYEENLSFVLEIYQQLLEEYAPLQIEIMGDSAGGGLAVALSLLLKEKKLPQPNRLILCSPWLDVSMSNPAIAAIEPNDYLLNKASLKRSGLAYAKEEDKIRHPLVSPLYGNLAGLPEMYLFIGTHDLLMPDCLKFEEKARREGVGIYYYEYQKMQHAWMVFPIPESREFILKIKEILILEKLT